MNEETKKQVYKSIGVSKETKKELDLLRIKYECSSMDELIRILIKDK